MEKRTSHYPLARIKTLIRDGKYQVTRTALRCAANDFGFARAAQIADCILGLDDSDFFKSMTTHFNSTRWQDVYRPHVDGVPVYVKVQVVEATTVVISFKALEDE